MLYMDEQRTSPVVIKVAGIGGGGMNAVTRMVNSNLKGVQFIVMNTDEQVLNRSTVENKVQLGNKITRGMGAGGDPDLGAKSAQEDKDKIMQALKGADMVFITAGMGGGTGTGAAPVVAEIARELKCLVVGVVTVPFSTEGKRRSEIARSGLNKLREHVDTLITIKNDSLLKVVDKKAPVQFAFKVVDDVLLHAVQGISDIINQAGHINVDFADVKSVMKESGDAIMGVGEGVGENRVAEAVDQAINNVLLEESSIQGASSLLINVSGGKDLSISDWSEVSQIITAQVDSNANIIIGLNEDENLQEKIRVTVIATGFKRIPQHHITPMIKRDTAQQQSREREEANTPKQAPKVVNIMDTEVPDNTRTIRPTRNPVTSGSNYYNEDYDIPTYLRKKVD
jgi:cell division protein FtsZ